MRVLIQAKLEGDYYDAEELAECQRLEQSYNWTMADTMKIEFWLKQIIDGWPKDEYSVIYAELRNKVHRLLVEFIHTKIQASKS